MSLNKIRWGIISTAKIAETAFIPAVRQTRRGEVVGIASRNRQNAESFAAENGIPKVYDDYISLLSSGEIDAVFWDRGGPPVTANTAYLFEDPLAEALAYNKESGVFPLNSMLLAKRNVIEANPGLGQAIVDASDAARELYFRNVPEDDDHMGLPVKWLRANNLFPHQNGVQNNRAAIETVIRYAHEQGIISRRMAPEELFFDGAK